MEHGEDRPIGASLERRVLRGTGLQLAARLLTAACTASALVVLGRALGPAGLGTFSFHLALQLVAAMLVDFGSLAIAVREASARPERESAIVRAVFRLRLLLAAGAWALLAAVAWWREGSARAAALPALSALHLLALAPAAAGVWLHVRVRLLSVAVGVLLNGALYLAASALLARARCADPGAYLLAFGGGMAAQALVPWAAARSRVRLLGAVEPGLMGALLRKMAPLGLAAAVSTAYFRLDVLVLALLIGEEAAGRYQHVFPLLSLAVALPACLSAALLPAMSRAAARGGGELLRVVRRAGAVLAGIALPACAAAPFLGGPLLDVLWTRGAVSEETRRCVPLLALAAVAIFLTYPQMHALTALGRQHVLLRVTLVTGAAKLALSALLVARGSVPGAAAATALTELLVFAWVSLELARASGGCVVSTALLRPLGAGAAAGAVAWAVPSAPPAAAFAAALAIVGAGALLAGSLPLRLGAID